MKMNPVSSVSQLLGYTAKVVIGPEDYYVALDTDGQIIDLMLNVTERQAEACLADYWDVPHKFLGGKDG